MNITDRLASKSSSVQFLLLMNYIQIWSMLFIPFLRYRINKKFGDRRTNVFGNTINNKGFRFIFDSMITVHQSFPIRMLSTLKLDWIPFWGNLTSADFPWHFYSCWYSVSQNYYWKIKFRKTPIIDFFE